MRSGEGPPSTRGFTLIELLVVLAVLGVLIAIIAPKYVDRVDDAREAVLRQNLVGLRDAIDAYYRDHGRYPETLDDLVAAKYIRKLPTDPITERNDTWKVVPPDGASASTKSVFDVRSGAPGEARDGSQYSQW
ncbi:prepilin-type N-terminal cleavage/methylation domain-containing protein [Hydrogenophaga sp. 5NK40-0174]